MAFSLQHNSIPEIFLVFTVFPVWPLVKGTAFSLFPSSSPRLLIFFGIIVIFIGIPSESKQEPAGASGEEREGIVRTKLNSVGVMEGEGASLIRIA